ncbi:MAG: hypothetical protein ACK5LC_15330 [Coprobacillaceae bacterium]
MFEIINPRTQGWIEPTAEYNELYKKYLGEDFESLSSRLKNCVYLFLDGLYDEEEKALHHYYRAHDQYTSEIDSGNFLMAINYLTMYDIDTNPENLKRAENCFKWAYENCTEIHPMFTWQGGVQDGFKNNELYVKYTGDAFWVANALYKRTGNEEYLFYIKQFHNFFKQARKNNFAYKFDKDSYQWTKTGFVWQSFGFPVTCYLELYEITKEKKYMEEAFTWLDEGLTYQKVDGGFYLIDGEFWNSDLTAPELRALVYGYTLTKDEKYLTAAKSFGDWLEKHQNSDGSWPIGIDLDGEVCAPNVGPGDMPNIAISLLLLHEATKEEKYLNTALKAFGYSLDLQAVEGAKYPNFLDDPKVKYGFWSWDPLLDNSLSGDQSVHHVRGIIYAMSYLTTLKENNDI